MSHQRTISASTDGSTSTGTSVGSDGFAYDVALNISSNRTTAEMFLAALEDAYVFGRSPHRFIPTAADIPPIDGGKVVLEMLRNANSCGGEDAKRYVASAIVSCHGTTHELVDLANTWVRYFLWPFLANTSARGDVLSEHATPTLQVTGSSLTSASVNRRAAFSDEVLERDGYRCVVTKSWHESRYPVDGQGLRAFLEGAHILKRAVTVFSHTQRYEATATWDIIRNYANLSDETVHAMEDLADDAQNGISLQGDAHKAFDRFKWTLLAQDEPNMYKVKQIVPGYLLALPDETIVFRDDSGHDRTLPNPKFIALHAALAQILHLSGAGEVIDLVMDRYSKDGPKVPSGSKIRGPDDWPLILSSLEGLLVE